MEAIEADKYVTVAVALAVIGSGMWMAAAATAVTLTSRITAAHRASKAAWRLTANN